MLDVNGAVGVALYYLDGGVVQNDEHELERCYYGVAVTCSNVAGEKLVAQCVGAFDFVAVIVVVVVVVVVDVVEVDVVEVDVVVAAT